MAKVLEVKNLSVHIQQHTVLNSLSFSVDEGTTTAIIGPNGAGKSVLVKSILTLLPKTSGEVFIFGKPQSQYRSVAKKISYIPQRLDMDDMFPLTVAELFSLKSTLPFGMRTKDRERMEHLLDVVGMHEHMHKRLPTLSGGQLQRVLLAYSLIDTPELLFLDEPAAGVDLQGQDTIYDLLGKIQQEENLTVVLISHELDVVMQHADQVLCLNKDLLCAGIPRKVLTNEVLEKMYGAPVGHYVHHH